MGNYALNQRREGRETQMHREMKRWEENNYMKTSGKKSKGIVQKLKWLRSTIFR